MPITYEPIATTTLGSAAATVTFSGISGSYTDLVLIINGKWTGSGPSSFGLRFNSDSGSNYSITRLLGDGSSASSNRTNNTTTTSGGQLDATNFNPNITHIMNYSNSTTYKTILWRGNIPSTQVEAAVSLWRNTSAITSISAGYFDVSANWETGSTFTLYGIKSA